MKFFCVGLLLAALILASNAANAPADEAPLPALANAPITAATATTMFPGVKCVLRARDGQTQFRGGETIHLIASFTSDRPGTKINRFVQNNRGMAKLGDIQISPASGVTDPLSELPAPNFLDVNGYVPEPVALGEKPVEFPFVLNDFARFDQTGVYQVTLATTRVFVAETERKIRWRWFYLSQSVVDAATYFVSRYKSKSCPPTKLGRMSKSKSRALIGAKRRICRITAEQLRRATTSVFWARARQ